MSSDFIDDAPVSFEASIRLPPKLQSVRRARRFLSTALRAENATLVETATLLVSELVTNAVRHAQTDTEVTCRIRGTGVRVEVADDSIEPATITDRGVTDPSGRGLRIVDALASAWGVADRDEGKIVWFELLRAEQRVASDERCG
jgi:anti-sigma regulatory factor (Ser/Thr protein kinase)